MDLTYAVYGAAFGIGIALFWSWATGKPIWPLRLDTRWLRNFAAGLLLYAFFWTFKVAFELQFLVVIAVAVASWIWSRGRALPVEAAPDVAYRRR